MKKAISISFAALYTLLTIGIQMHMHFCQDELKRVSFFEEIDRCCQDESSENCELRNNCCEFAQVDFSLEDEHQPVVNFSADKFCFAESQTFLTPSIEVNPSNFSLSSEQLRGPPERLYLLNCAFTFYG